MLEATRSRVQLALGSPVSLDKMNPSGTCRSHSGWGEEGGGQVSQDGEERNEIPATSLASQGVR